ncbi:MAG: (2Fe-2S)-binding protein [Candidatus Electryonea clarkiae]|nr:(2Fe-2S)-binding protein [Candidatus Electryonea clarkiae]MDP8287134.1 (2Fe-2S)-binding protein [Candidatus Electryonea clarkiae]
MPTDTHKITFTINGRKMERTISPSLLLIDLIREELSLKGTKPGCLEGECGACTVLINGDAISSCLYLAVNVNGKEITTIEGLSTDDRNAPFDPVQEAMIQHGGVQCGYCTPGMVMSIKAFQEHCEANRFVPGREEIKKAIEGNLCRCTGYTKIIDAVESLFEGE